MNSTRAETLTGLLRKRTIVMKYALLWTLVLAFCLLPPPDRAAGAEKLDNRHPGSPAPGNSLYFIWPDGRRAPALPQSGGIVVLPDGSLPEGDVRVLLPDGKTLPVTPEGTVQLPPNYAPEASPGTNPVPDAPALSPTLSARERQLLHDGTPLRILPDGSAAPVTVLPDGTVRLEDGTAPQEDLRLMLPDGTLVTLPPHGRLDPSQHGIVPAQQRTAETPVPDTGKTPDTAQAPGSTTPPSGQQTPQSQQQLEGLASLLPKTDIAILTRGTEPAKTPATPAPAQTRTEPEKNASTPKQPESAKQPAPGQTRQEQARKTEQRSTTPAPAPSPKAVKPTPKVKPGEELRIPPEAVQSGKLDFLEGCWEGTRPEYYSKRTIRECFCFGKGGRTGKRRIHDMSGKRHCVGATEASLNSGGVLHVYSEGAYCDDGMQWGSAEMTCRGNGQKTPCSWVFKDAQGGRQAYEIPFVRVNSCGR